MGYGTVHPTGVVEGGPLPVSALTPSCCPFLTGLTKGALFPQLLILRGGLPEWWWGDLGGRQLFPGEQTAGRGMRVWITEGPLPCPIFQALPRTSSSPLLGSWQRVVIEFAVGLRMKKKYP